MKGKEERKPGRTRKNGEDDSSYSREHRTGQNSGTGKRKFSPRSGEGREGRFSEDRPGRERHFTQDRPGFNDEKPRFNRDSDRKRAADPASRFRKDRDFRPGERREERNRDFRPGERREERNRDFRPGERREERNRDFRPGEGRGEKEREFKSFGRKSSFGKDRDFKPAPGRGENDRRPFRREDDRDTERPKFGSERATFKTFGRKKDEPFAYGQGAKPQPRPDYSPENLIRNLPEKQKKKFESAEKKPSEFIRLNRYIANSGLCSRREADDLIDSGQITVNGKTITEMGYQVKVTDVVKYGRKILNPEKLVYVLLNKPKDFITTTDDPEGRRTVMELVAKAGSERIYPVGRLDRATTGLLLFTNDGELAEKLSHPSHEIRKIYQVEIDKPFAAEDFDRLVEGVELEDGFIKPDEVSLITPDRQVIGIEIHSGKNRVVRRIFEQLGYEVTQLDRTTYAGLTKKDLPRGNWRFLTEKEVIRLKYMI